VSLLSVVVSVYVSLHVASSSFQSQPSDCDLFEELSEQLKYRTAGDFWRDRRNNQVISRFVALVSSVGLSVAAWQLGLGFMQTQGCPS
jgi:hypothetical protein